MTLNLNQVNCGQISDFINQTTYAITCAVVFILSIASLFLQMNYFNSVSRMYNNIRQKYIDKEKELVKKNAGGNQKLNLEKITSRNTKYINQMSFVMKEKDQSAELS